MSLNEKIKTDDEPQKKRKLSIVILMLLKSCLHLTKRYPKLDQEFQAVFKTVLALFKIQETML